jgi:hypothetical protein
MNQDLSGIDATTTVIGGGRIMTIKGSINTTRFQEEYRQTLENFISMVSDTARHAFNFLKFTFLHNSQYDPTQDYFNKNFFLEMWFSLVARCCSRRPPYNNTQQARDFINGHLEYYLRSVNYELPLLLNVPQSSAYKGAKINTAYSVNISNTFGNHLRRAVNLLLNVESRTKTIRLRTSLSRH